jgi:ATP-dependent RNA helicase DeaD
MPFPTMNASLARALAERGYEEPTAVQSAVLQPEAEGRDLLVSAQTGSGKTVAFGVALANTLMGDEERFGPAGLPLALIVAPTRELALQVQRELEWLYGPAGGKIASCVGGMDIRTEARKLQAGCHIVVGTPGRLKDHIQRKRLELSGLKAVVLDEADEMLDLGFREDLEFILGATPPERRTLLFSATIAHEIAKLAKTFQRDALRIQTVNLNQSHNDIEYRAIRVMGAEVERAIVNVLRFYDSGATLIFCGTREGVKRLHGSLLERGFAAVALSGELSQAERTGALQSLRDGRSRVCVATDVAARGLDLPDLGLVIHADLPNDRETLLHRSGRTGRAGKKGICLLMVPPVKRRRAEMLIRAANIDATWIAPPSADDVRSKDQDRMLNDAMFGEEMTDDDLVIARSMLEKRTPEDVALALVRVLRSRLPAPEDVSDPGSGTFKDRRPSDRNDRNDRDQRGPRDSKPWEKRAPRDSGRDPGFDRPAFGGDSDGERGPPRDRLNADETVWFRINIGRDRNAEPRWMIPLICKAGGITKAEIGSIRIFDTDSRFQISKAHADAFGLSVKGKNENNTTITPAFGPDDKASAPRSEGDAPQRSFKKAPFKHKGDFNDKRSGGFADKKPGGYGDKAQSSFSDKRDFGDKGSNKFADKSFVKPADDYGVKQSFASAPTKPVSEDWSPMPRIENEPAAPVRSEPFKKETFQKQPFKKAPYAPKDRGAGEHRPSGENAKPVHSKPTYVKPSYEKPDRPERSAADLRDPNVRPSGPRTDRPAPVRADGDAAGKPFKKGPFVHKGKDVKPSNFKQPSFKPKEFGGPSSAGKPSGDKPFQKPYKAKKKFKAQ